MRVSPPQVVQPHAIQQAISNTTGSEFNQILLTVRNCGEQFLTWTSGVVEAFFDVSDQYPNDVVVSEGDVFFDASDEQSKDFDSKRLNCLQQEDDGLFAKGESVADPSHSFFGIAAERMIRQLPDLSVGKTLGAGGQGSVHILSGQTDSYVGKKFRKSEDLAAEYLAYQKVGRHPNIAICHEARTIDGNDYLVMEKIEGSDLKKFATHLDRFCKSFPNFQDVEYVPALRLMLVAQLIDVLKYLEEKGICHGDLKPENIMLDTTAQLKLIDFGLMRQRDEGMSSSTGTPHFMAPESLLVTRPDRNAYNYAKVDSYAAANIILQLLTGFYLEQSGYKLVHQSQIQTMDSVNQAIYAGGINLATGQPRPIPEVPSSSGHFFSMTEEHPIDKRLYDDVIKPLQKILYDERLDVSQIYPAVKEMSDQYLTDDVKEQAIALFAKINHYYGRSRPRLDSLS